MLALLSLNVTVPVGTAVTPLGTSISTVKVTGCITRAGLPDDVTSASAAPLSTIRSKQTRNMSVAVFIVTSLWQFRCRRFCDLAREPSLGPGTSPCSGLAPHARPSPARIRYAAPPALRPLAPQDRSLGSCA